MNNEQNIKEIPSFSLSIPESKMYRHKSRLLDLYKPSIMEVNLPGYLIETARVKIKMYEGSTKAFENFTNHRFKKLDKLERLLSPCIMVENPIYDARYANHWNLTHILVDISSYLLEIKILYKSYK